jgi:AraC-like DNA-binding protein
LDERYRSWQVCCAADIPKYGVTVIRDAWLAGNGFHPMVKWQTIRSSMIGRHNHHHAYAAIVLSGGYEEAGDQGRFTVRPGDVVMHECFEAHINRFSASGAIVLNLPLPAQTTFVPGIISVKDPDAIVRLAERSSLKAVQLLLSAMEARHSSPKDWPDELASALLRDPTLSLSRWSRSRGLTPWGVSRGFMQVFNLSPSAFRARSRARLAWRAVTTTKEPLVDVAVNLGFADQPHMTRSIRQLTGKCPREWRTCK